MLTQHTKIKQLNVFSKKSSSNNDLLLVESEQHILIENKLYNIHATPQFAEFLIQGIVYRQLNSLSKLDINYSENNHYKVSTNSESFKLDRLDINDLKVQPHQLIDWVRQFKDDQVLYRQTGATESVGVILSDLSLLTIECVTFESALTKLLGALIKKDIAFYPILLISHRITMGQLPLINVFKPEILICQSAITANAVHALTKSRVTVYGFCRKHKFNRYSNFHL